MAEFVVVEDAKQAFGNARHRKVDGVANELLFRQPPRKGPQVTQVRVNAGFGPLASAALGVDRRVAQPDSIRLHRLSVERRAGRLHPSFTEKSKEQFEAESIVHDCTGRAILRALIASIVVEKI